MKRAYIKHLSALLLFGSNGIVAGYIFASSNEIVLLRTLIGSLLLIGIFIFSKEKAAALKNKRHLGFLILSGTAMGASWMFLYEAYTQIGVSVATLIYYCGPVIVMALSPVVFRERLTVLKILGFAVVLLGMVFVNGTALMQGGFSWGLICAVMSAVMYAVMVIFNKKATGITGLENSMYQLSISFAAAAVFTLIKQGWTISITAQSIVPLLFLGVVNTGIGCYLYFSSLPKLRAQSAAILGYLEPLSALMLSAVVLHERLTLAQVLGAVLILGGGASCVLTGRFAGGKKSRT